MKAYFIDFEEGYLQCMIDIGIGSIPYWEYRHHSVIIIARNRAQAWKIFVDTLPGEREDGRETRPTDFRIESTQDFCTDLTFIMFQEDVDGEPGIIEPYSGHPLCELVQHDWRIPYTARFTFGNTDYPLWVGKPYIERDPHIPVDTDVPWMEYVKIEIPF